MSNFDELLGKVLGLLDLGPKTYDELVESLVLEGALDDSDLDHEDLWEVLEDSGEIWCSRSDMFNRYDRMVDGLYLTHRLSEDEISSGSVNLLPDLGGLDWDFDGTMLGQIRNVEIKFSDDIFDADIVFEENLLKGPISWLSSFSVGDLIAVQRVGNTFSFSHPESVALGEAERRSIGLAVEAILEDNGEVGFGLSEVLLDTVCDDSSLFRSPVLPLSELIEGLNLEFRGPWFGPLGKNWVTPGEKFEELRKKRIFADYGFSKCCITEFESVLKSWHSWKLDPSAAIDRKPILKALSHGSVVDGLVSFTFASLVVDDSIEEFMGCLTSWNRPEVASAYYVRAFLKSSDGRALEAEQDLRTALRYDPKYEPAILELAHIDADRGNYASYISRLGRCDPGKVVSELEFASRLFPRYYTSAGRNDPCPCGSGRKYKACCLNNPILAPRALRSWLMYRVILWMMRPHFQSRVANLLNFFQDMVEGAMEEQYLSFVLDVAMFEAGGIDDYLELRHDLLSDDDLSIAANLTNSKRALFEIVEVGRGESLTLRDTLTGDTTVVTEDRASLDAKVGEYILGRAIESPEGKALVGEVLDVDLFHREGILNLLGLDYSAVDLMSWFAYTLQPPHMVNFDGDEIVLCKARIRSNRPGALSEVLDDHFDRLDGMVWSVQKSSPNGQDMSGGWLRFDNDDLIVETNSLQRLDWILERLKEVIGEFQIIERTEESLEQAREHIDLPAQDTWSDDMREQVFQALDQRMDEMEDKWLEESIPALGGLTPRQALDDPTRKEDLFRLLNEFERTEQQFSDNSDSAGSVGGGFNTSRIRAKLGI